MFIPVPVCSCLFLRGFLTKPTANTADLDY